MSFLRLSCEFSQLPFKRDEIGILSVMGFFSAMSCSSGAFGILLLGCTKMAIEGNQERSAQCDDIHLLSHLRLLLHFLIPSGE